MIAHTSPSMEVQSPRAARARFSFARKWLIGAGAVALGSLCLAEAPAKPRYPAMAPLEQYLMPRDAEIALARSAGPESVTRDAEVLVLGPNGYETAVPGHNGFVCAVQRAWCSPFDDDEFWNPKSRSPICWNATGASYSVPLMNRRTALALAGKSIAEIEAGINAAVSRGELPAPGAGAMCFMMSRAGHLNDRAGHWHPHLMFFLHDAPVTWGANLAGSPVMASTDEADHVTTFMVPVKQWSDGSPDGPAALDCDPTKTPADGSVPAKSAQP